MSEKDINQIIEEDAIMIDAKNKKLEEIKKLVKEIHELDIKLDTKRLNPNDDGKYTLLRTIEEEYDILIYVE
jgi:adenine C2-methylase RlmN of 23S rRNA A2503 and tRNA A37